MRKELSEKMKKELTDQITSFCQQLQNEMINYLTDCPEALQGSEFEHVKKSFCYFNASHAFFRQIIE